MIKKYRYIIKNSILIKKSRNDYKWCKKILNNNNLNIDENEKKNYKFIKY